MLEMSPLSSNKNPRFDQPRNFRSGRNAVWAQFSFEGPFQNSIPTGLSPAQKAGLAYERNAQAYLRAMYPRNYGGAQWIKFRTRREKGTGTIRWAQPDGLCIDFVNSQITIVEVKRTHDIRAWWGLRELYEPLIETLFGPSWRIAVCEVCRWFDPATPWPEAYRLVKGPMDLRPGEFGIHITTAR